MATGNSQQVAITASTNLTDEDIEKLLRMQKLMQKKTKREKMK